MMHLSISINEDKNVNKILRTRDSSTQTSISTDNDNYLLSILDQPERLEKENPLKEMKDYADCTSEGVPIKTLRIEYTNDDEPTKGGISPVHHHNGKVVRTTCRSREEMEKAKLDVIRLQFEFEERWQNLVDKLKQSGIEELNVAMVGETSKIKSLPIKEFQKKLRKGGEAVKPPAVVVADAETEISQSEFPADDTIARHEIMEELKRTLQASVQEELQALSLRLENQEQFWQNKLAYVQQDHEKQIQQLRQELVKPQTVGSIRKEDNPLGSFFPTSQTTNEKDENDSMKSKSQVVNEQEESYEDLYDGEDNDEEERRCDDKTQNTMDSHSSAPILLKGSGSEPHKPNHNVQRHQQQSADVVGVTQEKSTSASKTRQEAIPVAKPRKKRSNIADTGTDCYVSSTQPSPKHSTSHRQKCRESSKKLSTGIMQQQQQQLIPARSNSESEYLTVIQPEEAQDEKKHDNSVIEIPRKRGCNGVLGGNNNADNDIGYVTNTIAKVVSQRKTNESGGNDDGRVGGEPKSDISDYTLSDSLGILHVDLNHDEKNDYSSNRKKQFSKENSSLKQSPSVKKKKYIFDKDARKIVEVSSEYNDIDDEDEEEENSSDLSSNFNNSVAGDDDDDDESSEEDETENIKKGKSQVDLVRAKTIMELEKSMADIGLNPESTAIGLEEMGRVLKHLKSSRRASNSSSPGYHIQDQEQFEEERNTVKSFAKFAAAKSSIDEKLEAISTLNPGRTQQSSFVKIFSAVKTSGKNFRKRVASAVKKKQKNEELEIDDENDDYIDMDEDGGGDIPQSDKVQKQKSMVRKTKFFSKDRWTRKKKAETAIKEGKQRLPENQPNETENKSEHEFYDDDDEDSEEESQSEEESGESMASEEISSWNRIAARKQRASEVHSSDKRNRSEHKFHLENEEQGTEEENPSDEDSEDSQASFEVPSLDRQDLQWDDDESDIRLHEIKQFVNKTKKVVV